MLGVARGVRNDQLFKPSRGGPRVLPIDLLRPVLKRLGIRSYAQYKRWKRTQRPGYAPCNPERTYLGKGWVSWNDLLGNDPDKKFEGKPPGGRFILTYFDAIKLVHPLKFEDRKAYTKWYNKHPEAREFGLSKNPEVYYSKQGTWLGWDSYLGRTTAAKIITQKAKENKATPLVALLTPPQQPSNIFVVFIAREGKSQLQKQVDAGYKIAKVYLLEDERLPYMHELIRSFSRVYPHNTQYLMTTNILDLLGELDQALLMVPDWNK